MHRTRSRLLVSLLLVAAPAIGAGADQIPTPTATGGPGCWKWEYQPGQPMPDDAKVVPGNCPTPDGRCYMVPGGACLEVTGAVTPLFSQDHGAQWPPSAIQAEPPIPPPHQPHEPVRQRPTPPTGVALTPLPTPSGGLCAADTGWDFENFLDNVVAQGPSGPETVLVRGYASLDRWRGAGTPGSPFVGLENPQLALRPAPVYGNAVPIERIRPPGFSYSVAAQVGGDYWRFSQDINPSGDFWIGSLDRRYSWKHHPGDSWGEAARGTLTSPPCRLAARYLSFRLGGAAHGSQRVEVHVQGGRPRDYFGVLMNGGLGDVAFGGAKGFATQFNSPAADQDFPPPVDEGGWTTVRSAMPDSGLDSDWMQVFVFDLQPFVGRQVRIRIVDDRRAECDWHAVYFPACVPRPEHLQADDFRFLSAPPAGTQWYRHTNGNCGGVPGAGPNCSPIGRVPSAPPLWGVTDVHAHPMANLGFGGHVVWGDAADELPDVYDCSHTLLPISGLGGRPAINPTNLKMNCHLHGSVWVLTNAILGHACQLLPSVPVPVLGLGLNIACQRVVTAASAALHELPIAEGATLHGAAKISSGAAKYGLLFSGLSSLFGDAPLGFDIGLLPTTDSMRKSTGHEGDGWWKEDEAYHDPMGINKTHNAYQADMVRRAYLGGLRLAVWDVINSRALSLIADGAEMSDWAALKEETDGARRIVATRLSDIAAIVLTPEEAEATIRSGRMAIILGSEVDELGRARPEGLPWPRSPLAGPDSMQKQVDDLWALGIRKVTPVHAVNNPIGGAAIFETKYDANNHYLSGTEPDRPLTLVDLPAVTVRLDKSFGPLFDGLPLGAFPLAHEPAHANSRLWNPTDWFDFDTRSGRADDTLISGYDRITFRIGAEGFHGPSLKGADGKWLPPSAVLNKQVIRVRLIKGASFAATGPGCDLYNTTWPDYQDSFGPTVDEHYTAVDGHRNALGLYHLDGKEDGEGFLRAAMKKGMLIDTDHLSQNMRIELYELADDYASEAGWPAGQCRQLDGSCGACPAQGAGAACGAYPTVGVHSKVRGLEIDPSTLEEVKNSYGRNDEASRTEREVRRVAEQGGTFAVFPTGSAIIPPSTTTCTRDSDCASFKGPESGVCALDAFGGGTCQDVKPVLKRRDFGLAPEVANDCDSSSKMFAVKYLWLLKATGGRGLTPGTDLNGFMSTLNPRYGTSMPWREACGGSSRDHTDQGAPLWGWHAQMKAAQVVEASGVWYADYASRAPAPSPVGLLWGDTRYKLVAARRTDEQREDHAPRVPTDDFVYYNDYGPDTPGPRGYKYQDGNRPGAQLYPMKRWQTMAGRSGWDFNLDGLQHIGLFPDLLQDMRNVGVQWEQLGPLFHSARDYLATWRKGVAIGNAHP